MPALRGAKPQQSKGGTTGEYPMEVRSLRAERSISGKRYLLRHPGKRRTLSPP